LRKAPAARFACAALLLASLPAFAESSADRTAASSPPPKIVVTLPPLAWFVERLVGVPSDITVLLPPGANPHSFEPGVAQVRAVAEARVLVFLNTGGLPMERAAIAAMGSTTQAVAGYSAEESLGTDPHAWLAPRSARRMARRLASGLAGKLPDEADRIRERERALEAEITALDDEIRARLLPYRDRAFVSLHADWGVFAGAYGLRELTVERGHREPDAAALAETIFLARREGIRVVFVQPQYSRESAEVVAESIDARVVSIDPLARDWPGTLRAMTDALVASFAR
jgi:zinc transport system substrate-binding protein